MSRISTDINDAGYSTLNEASKLNYRAVVYLNGAVIKNVVTADEETGLVIRNVTQPDGPESETPGRIRVIGQETLSGSVKITWALRH